MDALFNRQVTPSPCAIVIQVLTHTCSFATSLHPHPCVPLLSLPISLYIYIYIYPAPRSSTFLSLSLYIYIYVCTLNPNSSTRASTCTASTKSHSHFDATSFLSQRFARGFLARRKVMQWWARKMYLVTLAQALVCGVQLRERLKHKPGTRGIDSCHMCTHT